MIAEEAFRAEQTASDVETICTEALSPSQETEESEVITWEELKKAKVRSELESILPGVVNAVNSYIELARSWGMKVINGKTTFEEEDERKIRAAGKTILVTTGKIFLRGQRLVTKINVDTRCVVDLEKAIESLNEFCSDWVSPRESTLPSLKRGVDLGKALGAA